MVKGSDNHNINQYISDFNCWIKADLTFLGLKQAIGEPKNRIYCGEIPKKLKDIYDNSTKYIERISIDSEQDDNLWFKQNILLNPELVSIIGNKGSGKSALSDIIGLLGNCKNRDFFSFLSNDKFFKSNVANKYSAKMYWRDNCDNPDNANLTDSYKPDSIEKVKYIPQSYFEGLCNNCDSQVGLTKSIENVIFDHLENDIRKGATNFEKLINNVKNKNLKKIDSFFIENASEIRCKNLKKFLIEREKAEFVLVAETPSCGARYTGIPMTSEEVFSMDIFKSYKKNIEKAISH